MRFAPRTPQGAAQPEVPGEIPTGIDGENAEHEMHRMSRRSFLWAGVTLGVGYAAWQTFTHKPLQDGILSPLRHALQFNEGVARAFLSPTRLAPTFPVSRASDMKINGLFGVDKDIDLDAWQLNVAGVHGKSEPVMLTLADIKALPRVEMVTEHKCIEGWSVIVQWAGARFADFAAKHLPPTRNAQAPDLQNRAIWCVMSAWKRRMAPTTLVWIWRAHCIRKRCCATR